MERNENKVYDHAYISLFVEEYLMGDGDRNLVRHIISVILFRLRFFSTFLGLGFIWFLSSSARIWPIQAIPAWNK